MASDIRSVKREGRGASLSFRVFGREITIAKSGVPVTDLSPLSGDRGWFPIVREPFTGAWQRNREIRHETLAAHYAVYSCITLIASDISKMCIRLVEQDKNDIWNEVSVPAFSPVLRKPNRYQNRIKFIESWVVSKLRRGNTYVLKQREGRSVVNAMYVLDPDRCRPMVAPDGSVYYQLSADNLAGIDQQVVVPASEIIHDTMCPLFHPLCGVSPLIACGLAAMQGLAIQQSSTKFFENGAQPGGVLTVPGELTEPQATAFKKQWEENYTGQNSGRVAVLGGGLKYEKIVMSAVESQVIEQLKWSAETICSCFHVPAYMVGVGTPPAYNNIEALNQQYYSQCLQAIIENIELLLDEGLGLDQVVGKTYGAEFDLDGLLRMDTATQYETYGKGITSGLLAPDDGRKKVGLGPVPGGDTPYLQQQNYSLGALAKRDAQKNPFADASKPAAASQPPEQPSEPAKWISDIEMGDDDVPVISTTVAWAARKHLALYAAR